MHLYTVPEPVPRWEGGKAGQCCGMAATPHRVQMSVSSRHLPLVVWLPESEAGEGRWLAHIPAEGSLGCLVGETWGVRRGLPQLPAPPGQPAPCLLLSLTDPEVPGLKIGVCYPVTSLQAAEVERQDVLDLLVSDLGQHRPFLLQGRERVSPKHVAQIHARQRRDSQGGCEHRWHFSAAKGCPEHPRGSPGTLFWLHSRYWPQGTP